MNGKIALITGGNRGLGKNMALRLSEKGVGVIITYNTHREESEEVVREIESSGGQAASLQLDVGTISSFDEFFVNVSQILQSKWNSDKFDFLVNNAGHGATIPFEKMTEPAFDRMLNVHFKGVYFLTQKALPLMNDDGGIINISSGTTRFSNFGYSAYASMKGAIEVFTKYLAKDLGPRGITANVIAPGAIETDFNNAVIRNNPYIKENIASRTPLGRVGQAEDIGGIVTFLCSDEAKWINGQKIEANGGISV